MKITHDVCVDGNPGDFVIMCDAKSDTKNRLRIGPKIQKSLIPENLTWPEGYGYVQAKETIKHYCIFCDKIVEMSLGSYAG